MQRRVPPPPVSVLFILPSLNSGGAERVLITLMNGLDRARFRPFFLSVSPGGELGPLIAPDVPARTLGKGGVLRAIPSLFLFLVKHRPAIVVTTMFHLNIAALFLRPFFPGTRFVVREAIVPSFFLETHPHPRLLAFLYRVFYPLASLVISPSQRMIDEFGTLIGLRLSRHVLLPNPVNLGKIRGGGILPFRGAEDTIQFVAAGRLHPQKGFDRLLAALPDFLPSAKWHLTILGQGPEQENLEALIQAGGLSDRVTLFGLTPAPWPIMAAADAFLLPSRYEGLPNVVLESLAVGTPVIATRDSGGIAEIAALAPPGSVTVTETMGEFLDAMRRVSPGAVQTLRPCLLPSVFYPEAVEERFESLLSSLFQEKSGSDQLV